MQTALIQNLSFPGAICRKSALDWSHDNKISVCTNKCIYILSSYCSPVETGFPLPLHRQVLPAPTQTLDFGFVSLYHPMSSTPLVPETIYKAALDPTLVPSKTSHFTAFKCAKWSPKGCSEDGSCLLAALSMDHRLVLYREKDREWELVCDLSEMLYEIHKSSWEGNGEEVIAAPHVDLHYNASATDVSVVSVQIEKVKQAAYDLAAMEITWTNLFGFTGSEGSYKWCYLIVAMKSGRVVWWKVSPDDSKLASVAMEYDTDLGLITSLCWQQTTLNCGFFICGTVKGELAFAPVSVKHAGHDPQLVIKPLCKLWKEQDSIIVDNIAVLKASTKKYIIVATKQCFLISCEVIITDTDTVIKNIGHSVGLHRLPVTGLGVIDSTVPQSNLLLTSMEGLIVKIKAMSKEDSIEFNHEAIQLDIDLKHNMIQGLGISPNGLLTALILDTAVWFDHLIKRDALQFVSFMNKTFEETFVEFERMLKPQFLLLPAASSSICRYGDYLECARISLSTNSPTPKLFQTLLGWNPDSYERLNATELYVVRFLLKSYASGLGKIPHPEENNLEQKLDAVESVIMRNYISKLVNNYLDRTEMLTPAQSQSLLLMADWLYIQYRTPVNNLYEAIGYDCPTDCDSIPPRETCRICQLAVKLENMRYGECEEKHKFARCCQSLILCDVTPYYQCLCCKAMALEDVWSNKFICTYCSFPMSR